MTDKMREEFEAAFREKFGFGRLTASANADAHQMLKAAEWAWDASHAALLKKQVKEQEEFLAHLADFEPEDTFHD